MPRWTDDARRKQAQRMKEQQIWQYATGPKTSAGKARSAQNAYKHGAYTKAAKNLRSFLRAHKDVLNQIKTRAGMKHFL